MLLLFIFSVVFEDQQSQMQLGWPQSLVAFRVETAQQVFLHSPTCSGAQSKTHVLPDKQNYKCKYKKLYQCNSIYFASPIKDTYIFHNRMKHLSIKNFVDTIRVAVLHHRGVWDILGRGSKVYLCRCHIYKEGKGYNR